MIHPEELICGFKQSLAEQWGYIYGETHTMWSEAKQKEYAARYKDDPDRKLSVQLGGKWAGHWVTDCSGIFAYWFGQLGGKMYHGSNTMYRSWCAAKGTMYGGKRSDGQPLKPGTAVFCLRESDGVYSHVGLYIGGGEVIEAEGTKAGVIKGPVSNKKWEAWGELNGIDYSGATPEPSPEPEPGDDRPTLRKGSKGDAVKQLQQDLIRLGYDVGSSGADGVFGANTQKAVMAFQKDHGLTADGVVGKKTYAALDQALGDDQKPAEEKYTVTITGLNAEQAAELESRYPGKTTIKKG